jgi:Domain of unknown function (DUF3471)
MRRCLALVASLALPAALTAQAPKNTGQTAVAVEFEVFADGFGGRLLAAFDSIPAAQYGYRPTPSQQTVGYIAQHLEQANYGQCGLIGGVKRMLTSKDSLADTIKARWPKDTLVARLDASLRYCDAALERLGPLDSPAVLSILLALETDLAEHYSQISVYMRLLNLVPPSALPLKQRTAIDLPASTLSAYVGTYEVAQGLNLVVTVENDALFIQSTPAGEVVRLWPESESDFFVKGVDIQVSFTHDANGTATGLVFRKLGRPRPAKKIR